MTNADAQAETGARSRWPALRDLALLPVIVVVLIVGAFVSPAFLMADNLLNVLQQSSELSILVIAQSLILICGKFDLSLESTVGVAPMFAAWLMVADTTIGGSGIGIGGLAGVAVALALGLAIGRSTASSWCGSDSTPSSPRSLC